MKYILIIIFLVLWGTIHSLFASEKLKKNIGSPFGKWNSRFYRLGYNLFSVASFIPIIYLALVAPIKIIYIIPFPWILIIIIIEAILSTGLVVGIIQTGLWEFVGLTQLTAVKENSIHELVTHGMYGYVRHPLYTIGMIMIWMVPVMTYGLLLINTVLTVYIVIGTYFEEKRLEKDFGKEYVSYKLVTPKFFPWGKRNKI